MYSTLCWFVEGDGTHNPPVTGSSPVCPILSTDTSKGVFGDSRITSISSNYANITQLTGKDWSHPAQLVLFAVLIKKNQNTQIGLLPILTLDLHLGSKSYQIFLQVRKKCVIFQNIQHFLQYIQGNLDIVQRTTNPLFYLMSFYARVCWFIRRPYGND